MSRLYYYRNEKKSNDKNSGKVNLFKKFVLGFMVFSIILLIGFSISGSQIIELEEVVVGNGDTLWSIVSENYDSEYNTRKIVYKIREINDLEDVNLQPGQKLFIPELE